MPLCYACLILCFIYFGLIHTCSAVATCVWLAYGLRPSHFDCLCQECSQVTPMDGTTHNGWPKDRHGCAIFTCGGRTVFPPMDVSCMDITAAGHFNHLLVYFMDTVSSGPQITDQTYVDQSFMDTTIMHQKSICFIYWTWVLWMESMYYIFPFHSKIQSRENSAFCTWQSLDYDVN